MTITVHTLNSSSTPYHLPYYQHMRCGVFLTSILAPAVGLGVDRETGDTNGVLIHKGNLVFKAIDKDRRLREILADGDTLHCTLQLGQPRACLRGNGDLRRPTQFELTLLPPAGEKSTCCCGGGGLLLETGPKKRKHDGDGGDNNNK